MQTKGQNCVEMTLALSQELGMTATTEIVVTSAYTSLNSAKSIQTCVLQCTIHVARMSMDDVLMTI